MFYMLIVIFIIQVVCEAFGQLIVQSVVLLRLKTLIQESIYLTNRVFIYIYTEFQLCRENKLSLTWFVFLNLFPKKTISFFFGSCAYFFFKKFPPEAVA